MQSRGKRIRNIIIRLLIVLGLVFSLGELNCYAASQFSISPMTQLIALVPGETFYGTFNVVNPGINEEDFHYRLYVQPFTIDEVNDVNFENNGDYNQMVNWITLEKPEGVVAPNETVDIDFIIQVPQNAPAGGQYAAIMVASDNPSEEQEGSISIKAAFEIAHLVYAEIAGETRRGGEVTNLDVRPFMTKGNVTASAVIQNTGNVHAYAKHILQVYPLFSDEEYYTNEENAEGTLIMPEATRYTTVSWDETPSIGIFRVVYTVEFEGVQSSVERIVFKLPMWLLLVPIIAILFFVILHLARKRKVTE